MSSLPSLNAIRAYCEVEHSEDEKRRVALIRSLADEIERSLARGQSLEGIEEQLVDELGGSGFFRCALASAAGTRAGRR